MALLCRLPNTEFDRNTFNVRTGTVKHSVGTVWFCWVHLFCHGGAACVSLDGQPCLISRYPLRSCLALHPENDIRKWQCLVIRNPYQMLCNLYLTSFRNVSLHSIVHFCMLCTIFPNYLFYIYFILIYIHSMKVCRECWGKIRRIIDLCSKCEA